LDFVSSTLANLANALGISMLMATLPLYVISLGGNKTDAGIVAGAAQLTAMLFRPFVGWLTDAWRRRPVVLIGTSCYGVASLVYLISGTIPFLLVGRMIHGFGASCYTTAANVYVADIAPTDRRAEALGLFSAAQAIGIMVGPVIGFFIIGAASFHHMFYFTGALAVVALLISLLAREKRQTSAIKRHRWSLRTDILATDALPMAWMALCMGMGFGAVNAFVSIFAQPRGVANPGFYFTVQAIENFRQPFGRSVWSCHHDSSRHHPYDYRPSDFAFGPWLPFLYNRRVPLWFWIWRSPARHHGATHRPCSL